MTSQEVQNWVFVARKAYKDFLKTLFGGVFYYAGLFYLLRAWNNLRGRRLTIVTYHRVTPKPLDQIDQSLPTLFITENTFRKHLTFFKKHYKIVRFSDLALYAQNKTDIPNNLLMITFDDGYEDNFRYGHPILREYNLPWTLFVATNHLGQKGVMWWDRMFALLTLLTRQQREGSFTVPCQNNGQEENPLAEILDQFCSDSSALFARFNTWKVAELLVLIQQLQTHCSLSEEILVAENAFLSWDQANQLHPDADVGSHTCSHTVLTGIDLTQVAEEVIVSKKKIQDYCHRVPLACSYPAGSYSAEIVALVAKAGYSFAVTQDSGVNNLAAPYTLKRINLWEGSANLSSGDFSWGFFSVRMLGFTRRMRC